MSSYPHSLRLVAHDLHQNNRSFAKEVRCAQFCADIRKIESSSTAKTKLSRTCAAPLFVFGTKCTQVNLCTIRLSQIARIVSQHLSQPETPDPHYLSSFGSVTSLPYLLLWRKTAHAVISFNRVPCYVASVTLRATSPTILKPVTKHNRCLQCACPATHASASAEHS